MRLVTFYNQYAARTVVCLVGVVGLCLFLYGGLMLGAVAHAAGHAQAEHKVRTLTAEVSELEAKYLSATKAISPARAAALGFVAPVAVVQVYADAHTGLTLR